MNKYQIMQNRRDARNLIRISNRNKDCFKWSSNESDAHIHRKLEICKWLKKQGKEFYTEGIFDLGNGRFDILNSDDLIIYEVTETETKESMEEKKRKYPELFEVIFVSASVEWDEKLIL